MTSAAIEAEALWTFPLFSYHYGEGVDPPTMGSFQGDSLWSQHRVVPISYQDLVRWQSLQKRFPPVSTRQHVHLTTATDMDRNNNVHGGEAAFELW